MRIRVFSDPSKLADAAAFEIAAWLRMDADRPTIGLAGGGTPRSTYEVLRHTPLPWSGVQAWSTDERFVPPGGPEHNGTMARVTLLDHVPATFHEVPFVPDDPEASAAAYERTLTGILPMGPNGPTPGLVVLGLGADGHTASLFPGSEALEADRPGYVATWAPAFGVWRLTATIPLLTAARRTMFIVSGRSKAEMVARVLGGSDDPAAVVSREFRDSVWLLDRDAGSELHRIGA